MKERYKSYMMVMVFSTILVFTLTFVAAYLSEDKKVMIDINSIGEANFEMFVLIPLTLISGVYLFYDVIRKTLKEIDREVANA